MVIIRLQGGLGNQLFQYALYLQLEAGGLDVRIDEESGFVSDMQRKPCLKSALGIDYKKAADREIKTLRDAFTDPVSRIRRKLTGRKNREWEEPDGMFHPEILTMDDVYLNGYFQSEAYFPDTAVREKLAGVFDDSIKSRLQLQAAEDKDGFKELADRIGSAGSRAVSLHIRRGDYLQPGTAETHGGICTEKYYEKAVSMILEKVPGAVFYVFSDDPEYAAGWTASHNESAGGQDGAGETGGNRFVAVDPGAAKDMDDASSLLLMRMCRHHILANSSFSWWGAWTDEAGNDRMLIAPGRWFNNRADGGIYTDRMQRIAC